jgi:hypothetical protein
VRIPWQSGSASTVYEWAIGVISVRPHTSTATTPTASCRSGTPTLGTTALSMTPICLNATATTAAASAPWPTRLLKLQSTPSPQSCPCHCRYQEPFPCPALHPWSKLAALSTTIRWAPPIATPGSLHAPITRHAPEGTIGPSFLNDADEAAGGHI